MTTREIMPSAYVIPGLALTPYFVIKTVCDFYNTTPEKIKERCRKKDLCEPRQLILTLLRTACKLTLRNSADYYGLHHATCLNGIHAIKNQYDYDKVFREKIICVLRKLGLPENHLETTFIKKIAPKTKEVA
jgi:chromosomal replication initiation ATPase DnaA